MCWCVFWGEIRINGGLGCFSMSLEAVWKIKRKDQEGECMRYQMNDHTNLLVKHFEGVCHQVFHVFSHNSPGSIQSQNHPSLHHGLLNPNPPEGGRKLQKSLPFWWISDGTAWQNTSLFWCFLVHNRCKPVAQKNLVHFLVVQHDLKTFKTKILVETGAMIKNCGCFVTCVIRTWSGTLLAIQHLLREAIQHSENNGDHLQLKQKTYESSIPII